MRVIYIDGEQSELNRFKKMSELFEEISSLELFQSGRDALDWAEGHMVDAAFLNIEMPELDGLQLAVKLKELIPHIRVILISISSQYAMEAWNLDAAGYILKPYTAVDIHKALQKCVYRPLPSQRVVIQTIPSLSVTVDGVALHLARAKSRELFALLVDYGERGITTNEGISRLWPDRPSDTNTQSLFRVTYKRLADALEGAGVGGIIASKENRRFLRVNQVDCDLYRILSGDVQAARKYDGQYMREYSWAEERNGQLIRMLRGKDLK